MTNQESIQKIVLKIEYEGTRYHGFQLQGKLPTIQQKLEKAIFDLTKQEIRVVTASRTDTGVHALEQVVSFRTRVDHPVNTWIKALNYYLPKDIAVKAAYNVDNSFNVIKHATSREYKYYILNSENRSPLRDRYCYQVTGSLDVEAMDAAARLLIGERDMASFVNKKEAALKSTVRRIIKSEFHREDDLVVFNVEASGFLMHQVRNTVGSLLRLGRGRITGEDFKNIIEAKEPGKAWPTAPARGLCLIKVKYNKPIGEV